VGQITKVETTVIKDLGANVILLEYGHIEGFIQMSHMTNKRIRSVHKHLKVGRREFMEVLRVDMEKHYVDLGKKSMKPEEVDNADKRYKKSKKVHEIMIECAIKLKQPIEQLYEAWGWDLYEIGFEHAFDALRVCVQ
jgi:translation initiation factor 2 subunit 1